jgi:hypothetical protein
MPREANLRVDVESECKDYYEEYNQSLHDIPPFGLRSEINAFTD